MLLSWCKELQGTKLKLNANSGRIIHSVSHNFVENEGTERDSLRYIWQIKSFCSQSYCGNNAGPISRVRRQQPVKDNAYVFHVPTTKESAVLPEASTQNLAIRNFTKVSSCRRILAAWDGKVLWP